MSLSQILDLLKSLQIHQARQIFEKERATLTHSDKHAYYVCLEDSLHLGYQAIAKLVNEGNFDRADALFENFGKQLRSDMLDDLRSSGYLQDDGHPLPAKVRETRQGLLRVLQDCFEVNFPFADEFYESYCKDGLKKQDFLQQKVQFVKEWFTDNLRENEPDAEQIEAIASVNGNIQVVARAGSGKTTTLINRALFLQKHCKVPPDNMLLLAFNRDAALEMKKRLKAGLGEQHPQAMTFHALAYGLVHPEQSPLFDQAEGPQNKSRTLQAVIDDHLRDKAYYDQVRIVMERYFRHDWQRIVSQGLYLNQDEFIEFRRAMPSIGLDGLHYPSHGEKLIADFLLEHGVRYLHERNYWWNGINYRPDFTVFKDKQSGCIIEYFGLEGNSKYDAQTTQKRKFWDEKQGWTLIELYPRDVVGDTPSFQEKVLQAFQKANLTFRKLSNDEIWQRIKDRAIDEFTTVLVNFVGRCRKLCWSPQDLENRISTFEYQDDFEYRFLKLAHIIFRAYLTRLEETGEDDFDGLMQKAIARIEDGQLEFKSMSGAGNLGTLRYIFVDEYQDFSFLFHRLIMAIKQKNSNVQFFCVGDDWQAINGFAGADLYYYTNFSSFFSTSHQVVLSGNYRSATKIVESGNALMQGLGSPAYAAKHLRGTTSLADLDMFMPTTSEQASHKDSLAAPILRIANHYLPQNKSVVVLSRTNSVHNHKHLEAFAEYLRSFLPGATHSNFHVSTTHKFKGLQGDVVIIIDAVIRRYPLIHPNYVFNRIFGETEEKIVDSERRLFYVAITRAIEHLIIFTNTEAMSPFISQIQRHSVVMPLDWSSYTPVLGTKKRVVIEVQNAPSHNYRKAGTYAIKDLLQAEAYKWSGTKRVWTKVFLSEAFDLDVFFEQSLWLSTADSVHIVILDELENQIARFAVSNGTPHKIQ